MAGKDRLGIMGIGPWCQPSCTEAMLRKVIKDKVMNICFWNQVEFMKEAEAVSGKRKKPQQPRNMLGGYKTENYSKPCMDLTWACAHIALY